MSEKLSHTMSEIENFLWESQGEFGVNGRAFRVDLPVKLEVTDLYDLRRVSAVTGSSVDYIASSLLRSAINDLREAFSLPSYEQEYDQGQDAEHLRKSEAKRRRRKSGAK